MNLKFAPIALFFIMLNSSCESTFFQNRSSNPVTQNSNLTKSILDKTWKIKLVNSESIQGDEKDFYLKLISNSNQLEAKAGCNQIFGEFEIKDNMISFSKIGSTKMYCFDTMKFEDALLSVLSDNRKVVIVDKTKFILLNDDVVLAEFELVK